MTATTAETGLKQEYWMLVRRGLVQRLMTTNPITGEMEKAWPVARTHSEAKRLAKFIGKPGVVPAMIGSIQGETLEGHIRLALEEDCTRAITPLSWRGGKPVQWGEIPFD